MKKTILGLSLSIMLLAGSISFNKNYSSNIGLWFGAVVAEETAELCEINKTGAVAVGGAVGERVGEALGSQIGAYLGCAIGNIAAPGGGGVVGYVAGRVAGRYLGGL